MKDRKYIKYWLPQLFDFFCDCDHQYSLRKKTPNIREMGPIFQPTKQLVSYGEGTLRLLLETALLVIVRTLRYSGPDIFFFFSTVMNLKKKKTRFLFLPKLSVLEVVRGCNFTYTYFKCGTTLHHAQNRISRREGAFSTILSGYILYLKRFIRISN